MGATLASRPMREIELLEKACEFLAECKDLDEIKGLRDKAEALRAYAAQAKDSLAAQNAAAIIKVRAERRIGELTREMEKGTAGRPGKIVDNMSSISKHATLADVGLSSQDASRCEAIAAIPADEFDEAIQEAVTNQKEVTSSALQKKGRTIQRKARKLAEIDPQTNGHASTTHDAAPRQWTIMEGDCVEGMASMKAGSVSLVVADPPYNIGIDYGRHYDDSMPSDRYDAFSVDWLNEAYRVLADDGTLWLIIGHDWARQVSLRAEDVGFHLKQPLVWYESFGVNCARGYNLCSRMMYWFVKRHERFAWNPEAVNRPSDRQAKYNDRRADPDGKTWDNVWGINPPIPRVPGTSNERIPDFPTQLPLSLVRPIVGAHSNPGELVIDPFSGSGTTGCACIELGRRFTGFELSPKFADLSRKRLLTHPGKGSHHETRNGTH